MKRVVLTEQMIKRARAVGLIAAILSATYGIAAYYGTVALASNMPFGGFLTLVIAWIGFGLVNYYSKSLSRSRVITDVILHHLFAVVFTIFIGGFSTAILCGWALLYLMAYLLFGVYGFTASVLALAFFGIFTSIVMKIPTEQTIVVLINILATMFVGMAAVAISQFHTSERIELQDSRHRERMERDRILTIINNLADAVFSINSKGRIQMYNAASLGLLDTNADLIGKSIGSVLPLLDESGEPVDVLRVIKKSVRVTTDTTYRLTSSGEALRIELTYAPIRGSFEDEQRSRLGDGYIVIMRDITKEKSLEEERDEFISVVSHELRTPVAIAEGTLGNTQIMLKRKDMTAAKISSSVDEAYDQVLFLARMINDLSTLSRAERGVADEAELIEVRELVHSLFTEYEPEASKVCLHLNLSAGPHLGQVYASRLYLHELLQNFITNSLKYTKKGEITINVRKNNGIVTFAVEDTGIGISKSDQAKIFKKFYRAEDYRTRETNGTGLGLYVAQKLANKLGTEIQVKSRINHGSTFTIQLPAADEA